jgi:hypothetical protein
VGDASDSFLCIAAGAASLVFHTLTLRPRSSHTKTVGFQRRRSTAEVASAGVAPSKETDLVLLPADDLLSPAPPKFERPPTVMGWESVSCGLHLICNNSGKQEASMHAAGYVLTIASADVVGC